MTERSAVTQKQQSLYPQIPATSVHLQKKVRELRMRKCLTHLFNVVLDILQKYESLHYLEKMKLQPFKHSWLLLYILQRKEIPAFST